MRRHRSARPFALAVGLAAFSLGVPLSRAAAEDLSGFSVVLQLGDSSVPWAIEIAPNDRWFLTASGSAIYLSDLKTGAVLRRLVAPAPGRLTQAVISKDGSAVFARQVLSDDTEEVLGWNAETGLPIAHAEVLAPAPDDPSWNWIETKWPATNVAPYDGHAPRKYLVDQGIDRLVDVNRVERVEPTNHRNIVQVTVAGEEKDSDESFAAYRFYFIDVIEKRILVDVSGRTLNTSCGQPHGAFAFDGRYLIVAPTALDASDFNINSVVVDTKAKPPVVKWSRPCQDFQVAGIAMRRGLIVVSASPDKATIWDPATAHQVARLDDIHDSSVLAWSRDLTTLATGFHEIRTEAEGHKFGVSVLRSGRKLLIPTDREILEIRFNPDGSAVFARTQAGWAAWDTSNGTSLPSDALPPSDEDFEASNPRAVTSPDGKFRIIDRHKLMDVATGRTLVTGRDLRFSDGSRYVWACSDLRTIIVWDAASGQQLWTATANDTNGEDFLVLQFPDGRVRWSEGAERLIRLVRGFQARPFDAAAQRTFLSRPASLPR
jgi:WD40 repeat protein